MINLKVSETEKYKNDKTWFKDYMRYIVPSGNYRVPDYDKMSASYKIVNLDLDDFKDTIEMFCNPLKDLADTISEELMAYPELKNKLSVLKGELVKRNDQFRLQLLTNNAKKKKDEELYNSIMESVNERVGIELESLKKQMEGMSQEDAQKMVEEITTKEKPEDLLNKHWLSELEIFYNKALRFCYQDQNIKSLQADTIEDAATADRCFPFNGWRHGKPYIEVRNPLHLNFHKDPNEPFIHKSDWIWYRKSITIAEAISTYNLEQDDIDKLRGSSNNVLNKQDDAIGGTAEMKFDHTLNSMYKAFDSDQVYTGEGLNQTNSFTFQNRQSLINESHFEFKAFKKLIFLSYEDEYGKQVVEALSDEFEIPDTATKEKYYNRFDQETDRWVWFDKILNTEFKAEEIWIPRAYEIVRLGNEVYPVIREVPYQDVNIEDPFSTFELSTKGCIFNARNADSVSLVQQALPSYFQLLYVKAVQNKELAKYQGYIQSVDIDQVPDELGTDSEGKPLEGRDKMGTWLAFRRKTNIDIFSGSQTSLGGLPPSTRSPGSSGYMLGVAQELANLQNLVEILKREVSMSMGISPQREANYSQGTNVSDNQQAVINSYTITEPLFYRHSIIWRDTLSRWLRDFRKYCQIQMEVHNLKDLSFEIWLPDGTKELLKVTPKHLEHGDIGLFLVSNSAADKYGEMMLSLSHAFSQNQGQGTAMVSSIIKDIVMGESPEEIHKKISMLEQRQQDNMQQQQQAQSQQQMELQKQQIQATKDLQAFEMQMLRTKAELEREKAVEVATIQALGFAKDQDLNNNGVPDVVDIAKIALAEKKLAFDVSKQKDDTRLKEEKLKIDKQKANQPKKSG